MMPSGGQWGFFGWHLVNPSMPKTTTPDDSNDNSAKTNTGKGIVITEGEYDTIAVAEAIDHYCSNKSNTSNNSSKIQDLDLKSLPVVSLPNGCGSLPDDLLPRLESFTKIYLWLDFDSSGMAAATAFAKKLGIHRCFIVRPAKRQPDVKMIEETLRGLELDIDIDILDSLDKFSTNFLKDANDYLRNGMITHKGYVLGSNGHNSDNSDSVLGTNIKIYNEAVYSRNTSVMVDMLVNAESIRHEKILTFADMKQEV